ncbi:hypothetical protein [Streptomyces sp. NPDC003247]|uniref:hypothetical protein n=1 Tax=Streptomyces sp. NPDC003247 TaxID=3364677 RepID=UPI003693BAA3
MAISLGTRVSAVLVAGAVAIVTAAVYEGDGHAGAPPRGGVGSAPADTGRPGSASPQGRVPGSPTPAASALGSTETDEAAAPEPEPEGPVGPAAGTTPSPAPSPDSTARRPVATVTWLPPGPASPDADHRPDPASVYDLLRAPDRCADALRAIPAAPAAGEWTVLRGLAHACLAVQGRGGSWKVAEQAHAALADAVNSCKGSAARRVLAALIAFHRARPSGTARLADAPATAAPACSYGVAAVDAGDDGAARPGETVRIALRGVPFDPAELARSGTVLIGGRRAAVSAVGSGSGVPSGTGAGTGAESGAVPGSGSGSGSGSRGDRLVLDVVVPAVGDAGPPRPVDVVVRYAATEAVKRDAFRLVGPEGGGPTGSPGPGSPQPPGASDGTGAGSRSRSGGPGPPRSGAGAPAV